MPNDGSGSAARPLRLLMGATMVVVFTASCTSGAPPDSRFGEPGVVADGLEAPWSIAFHGDIPLISERDSARIVELDDDGNASEVATVEGVAGSDEGGLLGIAIDDDYLYAYFTADTENRIERYQLTGEAGALSLEEPEEILDGIPAAGFHNGGRIAFGPDGMLYATTGDAGDRDSAQDLDSLGGKILRMTPDGQAPQDNPSSDSVVYSFGHRNPQGLAWNTDGTMYASEFGQDTWDELNIIEAGDNYGWPQVEGIAEDDEFVDPVQQWAPADASPSGMAIAGDHAFVANLRGERLIEIPLDEPSEASEHFNGEFGRLRDAITTPDGSLWLITNNTDGRGSPDPDDDRVLNVDLD